MELVKDHFSDSFHEVVIESKDREFRQYLVKEKGPHFLQGKHASFLKFYFSQGFTISYAL
jgi:hypothetical protein